MAIYKNEAVTETMFSACPEYRRQTPLVMCAKLLKSASPGARLDYGENRIKGGGGGGWVGGLGLASTVGSRHTLTHTEKSGWVSGTF